MSEMSGFFGDNNGDRLYTSDFLAKFIRSFIGNGVYDGDLAITAGQNMQVTLPAGQAWINGYYYCNDAPVTLALANADGVLKRKDVIVLRWDINSRSINVKVLTGTFASSPVAPAITRTAEQYDLKLAEIDIAAGATAIAQANITDTRYNTDMCGIVAGVVSQLDTTALMAQLTDAFNTWFNGMKGQLTTDAAGNLQTEIDNIISGITKTAKTAYADTSGNVAQQMDIIDGNFQVSSIGAAYDTPYAYSNYGTGYPIWDTWKYNTMDTKCGLVRRRGPSVPGSHDYAAFVWSQAISHQGTGPDGYGFAYQFETIIENGPSLLGKSPQLTLSFWAKADADGRKLRIILASQYGTGGNPSSTDWPLEQTITLTTTWTRYTLTFNTVDPSTRTFGTNHDDIFWLDIKNDSDFNSSSSGEIDFVQFQLDIGEVALPYRPKSLAQELQQTMRYFERNYDYGAATGVYSVNNRLMVPAFVEQSGGAIGFQTSFKVPKRIPPTVTYYEGSGTQGYLGVVYGNYLATHFAPVCTAGINGFDTVMNASALGTNTLVDVEGYWVADARY